MRENNRSPEATRSAVRITAVPRKEHMNSGLQALYFAERYRDEVWALPAQGSYVGVYDNVHFSVLDTERAKAVLPTRAIRALYLLGLFWRILFRFDRLFIVHSFTFAIPLWLLRRRYCIFIHGSDRRFLSSRWGRSVVRGAVATYGVGFGTREPNGAHVHEVPNIFVPASADAAIEPSVDVLFVLRNAPVKNPLYPLDLAARLGAQLGLRIAVIGVSEDELPEDRRGELVRLRTEGVQIAYLGRKSYEAVVRWMSASRILMIPSHSEGLPKALLEGMSQGLDVIINAPLTFIDEIMARVDRLDVNDWDAVARAVEKLRARPRNGRNIAFAEQYLVQSQQALFEVYDRLYSGACA